FVTQSANYSIPSTAICLSDQLGLSKDCMAYDINLGCSAYDLGIQTVASLLQSQEDGAKALVFVGDVAYVLSPEQIFTKEMVINSMMFGAAGAVVALEKQPMNSFLFLNHSDGSGYDAIIKYPLTETRMKGNRVFEFAINDVVTELQRFRDENGLAEEDVDYYVFHQAQKLIIDTIVNQCQIPEDKVLNSYEEYGNTSGASVPVSIEANIGKINKEKIRICSCGFGVGLSVGISYYEVETKNILPIIETDSYNTDCIQRNQKLYNRHALLMDIESDIDQLIGCQLDLASCALGVYGATAYIESIKEQLFWKEGNEFFTDDEKLHNAEYKYDAMLISLEKKGENQIKDIIKKCINYDLLNSNASIVLYGEEKENIGRIQQLLEEIEDFAKKEYRANAVLYDSNSFELIPVIKNDMAWLSKRIEKFDDFSIHRAYLMTNVIQRLVERDMIAISKTVIHISKDVEMFWS
ncbi:MAG: 3-oxoacyl-[acyl-carrier-protein] synthase III C-terminal domain-containing protein, partial [Agathobacter sp.]|nr:3-oxoacyl-[acyl-carrier-protein] synthase III C-terminal domain-containing protein [Agathobacter sp.]